MDGLYVTRMDCMESLDRIHTSPKIRRLKALRPILTDALMYDVIEFWHTKGAADRFKNGKKWKIWG